LAGINATDEEKRQLAMKGYSDPVILPGAEGPDKATYHNPKTGKEMILPIDPHNLLHYMGKGYRVGPASPELKEKWANRKIEDNETISGAVLPPELRNPDSDIRQELKELKEMMAMFMKGQIPATKDDIIEVEEKEQTIPYDTQLGMFE